MPGVCRAGRTEPGRKRPFPGRRLAGCTQRQANGLRACRTGREPNVLLRLGGWSTTPTGTTPPWTTDPLLTDTLNEEDRDGLGEWDAVMVRSPGRSIVGMVALWWSSCRGDRWRVRASG